MPCLGPFVHVLLAAALLQPSTALEHAAGAVAAVDDEASWVAHVVESPYPVFTFFHSSTHKDLPPELDVELGALAKSYAGMADVVKVDCAPEATMRKLCQASESIPKLPHMRVYAAAKQKSPYTKEWYKDHKVYEGSPLAKDMAKAVQAQILDTHILRVPSIQEWLKLDRASGLPQVLVFSRKQQPSVLMRAMALHFAGRLEFLLIAAEVSELMDEFSIEAAPALVVRKTSGETEQYAGKLEAPALADFLRKFAPATVQDDMRRQAAEDAVSLFSHAQNFRNVTLEALPQLLEAEEDIWLLAFVREGAVSDQQEECQSAVRHLMNVTQEVGDMVKVGLATLSDDDLSNVESVAGVPRDDISGAVRRCKVALRAKAFGEKTNVGDLTTLPSDITSKAAIQHVYGSLPDLTVHITGETLPAFLGMQPGGLSPLMPKVILATAKHEAPPLFKLLAANFRKRALAFGWFSPDLDPEVAQQIPTAKRPAMLVAFVDPQSAADEQGRVPLHMEPYSLPLRYKPMAAFLESVLRRLGEGEDEDSAADSARYSGGATIGGALVESDSDATLATQCTDLGGVCLVALLEAGSASHEANVAALQALQSVRRGQPIHFTWVNAPRQRTFASAFVSESAPLPTAIILAPRKMRFSQLQGAFTQESLSRFIDKVLGGQMATSPLGALPGLVQGGEAQENAEPEAPLEDEFDLSDIMGTAVEDGDDRDARLAKAQAEAKEEAKRLKAEDAAKAAAAEKEARRAAAQKAKRKREAAEAAAAAQREDL